MHHKSKHSKSEIATASEDAGTRPHRWLLPVLLVAQLMVILDITAVNIALPHIATDLQLSGSSISWTITSYSVIFGSLLLFGGRAADLLGRRRMFLTGLGVFTASSLASAMAGSAAALFAARAGQGLGAAMLSPAALSILMAAFQGSHRAKALAAWGAVGGAGAAIGVVAGGVLTEFADWRMIFYVNLPVAAVLLVASLKVVPADSQKPRWRGLDLPGAALATTSLAAIVYGITQADSAGWTSIPDAPLRSRRPGRPRGLRDLRAPHRRTAAPRRAHRRPRRRRRLAPHAARRRLDLRALPALLALPPERPRHGAARDRVLAFIPLAVAAGIGAHLAGHVIAKHGVRGPLAGAFLVAAVGMFLLSRVGDERQLPRRCPPRHAGRRSRTRRRGRLRLHGDPDRLSRRRGRDAVRPQLDRPRNRRHARHRRSSRRSPPERAERSSARTQHPGIGTRLPGRRRSSLRSPAWWPSPFSLAPSTSCPSCG